MSVIQLENIQLNYRLDGRAMPVLRQVDFTIEHGEMVAILGPSGSGKSTLLYILGCLLRPTSGRFTLAGQDISRLNNDQLAAIRSREIGFVFQQFHLLARADVLENVMLAARYNAGASLDESVLRAQAAALIAKVGLTEHSTHRPNQLSGGQQQRVAIARALMNDPSLILADEPTGNLDSKSSSQVLDLLGEIHRTGRTVIIITHDAEVAARCERVVRIHDGVLVEDRARAASEKSAVVSAPPLVARAKVGLLDGFLQFSNTALRNLRRNKARSFLTMLGVTIGIAAVLSTITLGAYTEKKILETYENLGVNKLVIRVWPRWHMKAVDIKGVKFEGVSEENDIAPMKKLFPEIFRVSPVIQDWSAKSASFGGRSDDQIGLLGVTHEYFAITNRHLAQGQLFTRYHETHNSRVCVIGPDLVAKLFKPLSPLGQILEISGGTDKQYACQVIGVLKSQTSNSEWFKPNQQIILPEGFLTLMTAQWYSKPHEFDVTTRSGISVDDLTTKIKQFFFRKYGRSAEVSVDSDEVLVAQMRRFLSLFSVLLSAVAFISLAVGGIGITNMMLVSVAERYKEIGLRKALGARDSEIRLQFLVESLILCTVAGLIGVIFGIFGYHGVLYFASKLSTKIVFEWVFNVPAMLLSIACIVGVGVASGIVPALRAEHLEVVEALRSE